MSRGLGACAVLVVLPFLLGAASVASDEPEVEFTFQDPAIVESSGLAVVDGLYVSVNDSGDSARVFTVDPTDGYTVGVSYWNGDPEDDEAVAPAGDGSVWVADIGDNLAQRPSVEVLKVPVGRGDRTVEPERHELVYPDGPHDAETLLVSPTTGQLFVVTKGVFGGTVYAAPDPLVDGPNPMTPLGDVLGLATDGAFFPDGEHVVLRDYTRAVVYSLPTLEPVGSVDLPTQEQGESIAVDDEGRLFVGSEGRDSDVLRVRLPTEVREAMGTVPPVATAQSSPFPGIQSREGRELPEATTYSPAAWPWFLTGLIAVGFLMVLLRSMRTR
ncbi:MAG: hypothetical protein LH468_11215 [Nocardioides sp.]|nr:hypothetical protein [Nocardioides sp.]